MKRLLILLLLAGCSHTGIRTQFVDRPVLKVEKCIKKGDIPVQPKKLSEEGMPLDLEGLAAAALAKVSEWTRYGGKADILFSGCTNSASE